MQIIVWLPASVFVSATYPFTVSDSATYYPDAGAADSFTKLLLHADGTDTSTTFTDSEATPKTVTANGNAQIDTAQYKFGTASGLFDGTNDYLTIADSDDFYFAGDFTIDFWVRFSQVPAAGATQYMGFFDQEDASGYYQQMKVYYNAPNSWYWHYVVSKSGGGAIIFERQVTSFNANQWYHMALVRSGDSWYWFRDGIQMETTGTVSGTPTNVQDTAYIGTWEDLSYDFYGWLDEFRISKGIARWTADFTPETAAYSTAETTSVDGYVIRQTSGETWAAMQGGAGNAVSDTANIFDFVGGFSTDIDANEWKKLSRSIMLFDTSGLPDTATISAATLSLYCYEKNSGIGTPALNIFSSNPASNTALVAADYTTLGTTAFATAITFANISTTGYNDFTLNATGRAEISLTWVSRFGCRESNYDAPNSAPAWVEDTSSFVRAYTSEKGTGYQPKLVVTYSLNTAPPAPSLTTPVDLPDPFTGYATYGRTLNVRPKLVWACPTDADNNNLHFKVYYNTTDGSTEVAASATSQTGFEYYTTSWVAFPAGGVSSTYYTNGVRYKPQANLTSGGTTYYWKIVANDGTVDGSASSVRHFKVGGRTWTDSTLTAGTTLIRKTHVDELREEIDYARNFRNLADYTWTDSTITAGTTLIRKTHVDEMRTAEEGVAAQSGESAPSWTDSTITAGTTLIRDDHFQQLRDELGNI